MTATILQTTMFTEYQILNRCFAWMRYGAFGLSGICWLSHVYIDFKEEKKASEGKSLLKEILHMDVFRRVLWCGCIMLAVLLSAWKTGDRSLLFVSLLLIAAEKTPTSEIFDRSLKLLVGIITVVVLSSKASVIPDLFFKRENVYNRHALGFTYPSVLISYFVFMLAVYLWNRKDKLQKKEMMLLQLVNFLFYEITDSRMGFLLIFVMILGVYLMDAFSVSHKKWELYSGKKRILNMLRYCIEGLPFYLTLLLGFLCMILPTSPGIWINRLLTNRITYMIWGVRNFGIHLLGTHIDWVGFGGSTNTDSLLRSYNFVDCSYGYALLNFGVLVFILIIGVTTAICRKVCREGNRKQIFLLTAVFLYCFVEPRLTDLHMNLLLFLGVPYVSGQFLNKRKK